MGESISPHLGQLLLANLGGPMISPVRRLSVFLATLALAVVGLPTLAASAPSQTAPLPLHHVADDRPQTAPYTRYEGANRYETAALISQRRWPSAPWQSRPTVYLARGDVFADALAAGTLRYAQVLLVPSCGTVPAVVLKEIRRLGTPEVVALGGAQAVCDDVLRQAAQGQPTRRVAGTNRYGTAVAISKEAFPFDDPVEELYLAAAADSPDAVAGGVLTRGPVLLVPSTGTVPSAVLEEVARLQPKRVLALGGSTAVSDSVLAQAAQGRPTDRLAGENRYATAVAIARHQFPQGGETAYLARGDLFADAIAGGSFWNGPVLLMPPQCGTMPSVVADYLRTIRTPLVAALGGTDAVCYDTLIRAAQSASLQVSGPTSLPDAVLGRPYQHQLTASNGVAPFLWSATGLPPGITLDPSTGLLSGTPMETAEFNLGISTSDQTRREGWVGMHITVLP